MANRDNPIGFRPAQGIGSQHVLKYFPVDVANGTALFVGDVVDLDPNGGVIPAAADAGVSAAGVCVGVYDTNGVPCGSPNSAVSTKYLTVSTRGYALVALAIPGAVFVTQASDGSISENDIGATADHVAGTGDTTTARSRHVLNSSTGGLQFRILGHVDEPNNAYGADVDLYVVFNESAFGASAAASV